MHFCPTFEVAFHCGFWVQSPKRKRNGQQDCFTSLFGAFYLDINQSHRCDVCQSGRHAFDFWLFDIILININFEFLRTRVKNTMDTNYPFKTLICTYCARTHTSTVYISFTSRKMGNASVWQITNAMAVRMEMLPAIAMKIKKTSIYHRYTHTHITALILIIITIIEY